MVLWAGLIQPSSPVPSPPYCLFPIGSLLRGAYLEFHCPWGFLVSFTVTSNQVAQPGPYILTLIETQWIPLLELLQEKKMQNLKIGRINIRSLNGKEWGQYRGSHNPKNRKQDHLTLFPSHGLSESVKKKKKITTLRWHVQTRLFLPRATVRRSGASRGRKKARPRGWLGCVLSAFRPRLMELLFIFVIFRGRPATAEEDCICWGAAWCGGEQSSWGRPNGSSPSCTEIKTYNKRACSPSGSAHVVLMEASAAQSVNDRKPWRSLQRLHDAIKVTDGMATAVASRRRSKSPSINSDWNGHEHLQRVSLSVKRRQWSRVAGQLCVSIVSVWLGLNCDLSQIVLSV